MMDKIITIAPFDTQMNSIDRCMRIGRNTDHTVIADVQIKLTTHAAIGAGGRHFLFSGAQTHHHSIVQCACWTGGYACSAGFTTRVEHGEVCTRNDTGFVSAPSHTPDETTLNLITGADTTGAKNALIHIHPNKRVRIAIYFVARNSVSFWFHYPIVLTPSREISFPFLFSCL